MTFSHAILDTSCCRDYPFHIYSVSSWCVLLYRILRKQEGVAASGFAFLWKHFCLGFVSFRNNGLLDWFILSKLYMLQKKGREVRPTGPGGKGLDEKQTKGYISSHRGMFSENKAPTFHVRLCVRLCAKLVRQQSFAFSLNLCFTFRCSTWSEHLTWVHTVACVCA